MATYTATAAEPGAIQPKGLRVGLIHVSSTYSLNISTSIDTVIQMVKVPANATPVFIRYGTNIVGDHTTECGDGNALSRYKSAQTVTAGMGLVVCNLPYSHYTYSVDDTIDLHISLASITTLGGAYYLQAIFSMDP